MCGPRLISGAHEDFLLFDRTAIEVAIHWQSYTEGRNDDDRFVNVPPCSDSARRGHGSISNDISWDTRRSMVNESESEHRQRDTPYDECCFNDNENDVEIESSSLTKRQRRARDRQTARRKKVNFRRSRNF